MHTNLFLHIKAAMVRLDSLERFGNPGCTETVQSLKLADLVHYYLDRTAASEEQG